MDWTLYEHLDRLRRQQGALLDALGLGPVEAPCREVFRAPGVSLRRYGSGDKTVLHYEGDVGVSLQHVGTLVGRRAHALLWPRILDWIERVG